MQVVHSLCIFDESLFKSRKRRAAFFPMATRGHLLPMEKEVKRIKVYEEKNTINDLSKHLSLGYMASVAAFTHFYKLWSQLD